MRDAKDSSDDPREVAGSVGEKERDQQGVDDKKATAVVIAYVTKQTCSPTFLHPHTMAEII